jgi:hypothetical protein
MAKSIVLPSMRRRRGNPNWGQPIQGIPPAATEFEKQLRSLGLTKQTCAGSAELRKWCELHRNQCYIPEWLLKTWGIEADSLFGA